MQLFTVKFQPNDVITLVLCGCDSTTQSSRCSINSVGKWHKKAIEEEATKLLSGLKNKGYKETFMELKLPTLKYRRITEVCKLLTNKYHDNTVQLDINADTRTMFCPGGS